MRIRAIRRKAPIRRQERLDVVADHSAAVESHLSAPELYPKAELVPFP